MPSLRTTPSFGVAIVVETPDEVLYHMEAIDIQKGEYLCWDANGRAAQILVFGRRVTEISYSEAEISLAEAFTRYSEVHGLDVDTTGPFDQVWRRLKQTEKPSHGSGGLLSRLFRRSSF